MGELLFGIVIGMLIAAPITFLVTAWMAGEAWRCVPCDEKGHPIRKGGKS